MRGDPNESFPREDNCKIAKKTLTKFENLLNRWANFNQIWQKLFLGEGKLNLFKLRVTCFLKERK